MKNVTTTLTYLYDLVAIKEKEVELDYGKYEKMFETIKLC